MRNYVPITFNNFWSLKKLFMHHSLLWSYPYSLIEQLEEKLNVLQLQFLFCWLLVVDTPRLPRCNPGQQWLQVIQGTPTCPVLMWSWQVSDNWSPYMHMFAVWGHQDQPHFTHLPPHYAPPPPVEKKFPLQLPLRSRGSVRSKQMLMKLLQNYIILIILG